MVVFYEIIVALQAAVSLLPSESMKEVAGLLDVFSFSDRNGRS